MAMEVFGNLLNKNVDRGEIGLHPLGLNPRISHLCFADDILIFLDGEVSSLQGLNSTLETFENLSGLAMNKDKYALYTAGLTSEETTELAPLGFHCGSLPVRYLGLPLYHRKLRPSDFSLLTDQISDRFNSWAAKVLSFAGRLQLISSVIYSTVNFWFAAFSLPKCCISLIETLCNRFHWAGDLSKRAVAKVAWSSVCLPKAEGGLGLRNFRVWNTVLTLKLFWLLFSTSDSLWVAWNWEHRLKQSSIWYVEPNSSSSWIWKHILSLRPLAQTFLKCVIGDGLKTSFWFDSWLDIGPLTEALGNAGTRQMGVPLDAMVIEACDQLGWRLPSARTHSRSLAAIRDAL